LAADSAEALNIVVLAYMRSRGLDESDPAVIAKAKRAVKAALSLMYPDATHMRVP